MTPVCFAQNEDLEVGVLDDGIYFSTTAFRSRGKCHLAYYRRSLHVDSSDSILQLPPEKVVGVGFTITLTMQGVFSMDAQTVQLQCPSVEVAGRYNQPLTLCSFL